VRATRLHRFNARNSGQRAVRSSALPSWNGMANIAFRGVLSDRTLSVGPHGVLESLDNPFGDGPAVPSMSVNGSSKNGDTDDEFSAPSEGTVQTATSPTDGSRQSREEKNGDTFFSRDLNLNETRNGGGNCAAEHTEANVLDLDYMLAANMDILQGRGGISSTREVFVLRGGNNRSAHKAHSLPVA
jgi:hypothetical protein